MPSISEDFFFGRWEERHSDFHGDLGKPISTSFTSDIDTFNGVGKSVTFIDGYGVGDTITRVDNDTGGSSWGVKGEDSLNSNIEAGNVESFEQDLGHLLSVGLRVHGSFSEEGWVLFRGDSELVEESMMPDSFHVFPVSDNTVFNWVFKAEYIHLGYSFISDVCFFVIHIEYFSWYLSFTDYRRKTAFRSIFPSNTGFKLARSVIDNNSTFSHSDWINYIIIYIFFLICIIIFFIIASFIIITYFSGNK